MPQDHFKLTYRPELDGLRGIAVLGVMIYHVGTPFFKGGFIGVDIFFILSGFLITSLLISEFDESGSVNLKSFYMRRVLRLGPALIMLLIVYCLASYIFLNEDRAARNYVDALISLLYISNWARAFGIHAPAFLGHTWSLSIEEQFYVVWPIVLLTLLRMSTKRRHVVIFAIAIALFSWIIRIHFLSNGATIERVYNGLDTRADALMVGCALGVALSSGLIKDNVRKILLKILEFVAPLSVVGLFIFSAFGSVRDPWAYYFGFLIVELLTAALVIDVLINQQSIIRKFLVAKSLVWTGSISYGLYLWHYPIYRTMFDLGFSDLAVITIGSFISFLVAAFSYYAMEKPLLKFKKYFARETSNTDINSTSAGLRHAVATDA